MRKTERNIKRWVEAEMHPSAHELADVFWAMDAEEQAEFFNRLGEVANSKLCMQMQCIIDSQHLSADGAMTLSIISDYA